MRFIARGHGAHAARAGGPGTRCRPACRSQSPLHAMASWHAAEVGRLDQRGELLTARRRRPSWFSSRRCARSSPITWPAVDIDLPYAHAGAAGGDRQPGAVLARAPARPSAAR
ncbi:MAG: hypothetical protein MZV49_09580 [Rhodopseudomonas palustris]|nr:hypothetical protein [Rhodopseudomonas palustris]